MWGTGSSDEESSINDDYDIGENNNINTSREEDDLTESSERPLMRIQVAAHSPAARPINSPGEIPKQVWMNVKHGGNGGNGNGDLTTPSGLLPLHELQPSSAFFHAGYRPSSHHHASHPILSPPSNHYSHERSLKPPVYKSSTFEFASAEEGELYFKRAYNLRGNDGIGPGLIYSRINNPNIEILEDKMVSLEKGSDYASAFPSGMSAITTTIMALVPHGGHILYSNPVYGGIAFFFDAICPSRLGITCQSVEMSDKESMRIAIDNAPRVDLIYIESPANPTLALTDIAFVANMAKLMNGECLVFVDNTLMGPVFQSPLSHGADVVLYSATSFLGGHSDLIAGVVLTNSEGLIYKINGYRTILGPVLSPDVAWMLSRSLETVWMRMEKQASKAIKVASALAFHPYVTKVYFPGNYSHELNTFVREEKTELFRRQCSGTGSMLSIVVRPNTRRAAYAVLNSLQVAHLAVSFGGTETLVEHPRSMTHSNIDMTQLDASGICEGMIRISVGLESSKDLIRDFLSGLDKLRDIPTEEQEQLIQDCDLEYSV